MERILSKEEIAELLSAVQHGEIPMELDGEDGNEREVTRLSLVQTLGQRRWRIGNYDLIMDAFARNYGISMTNRLQRSVTVRRTAIETMDFDAYLQQLSTRSPVGIVRLDPLRWGGLITFDENLAFAVVETLLGGGVDSRATVPERAMTAIEMNILKGGVNDACLDLAKSFRPVEKIEAALVKIENNHRLLTIFPPETPVLVTRFDISVNNLAGRASLVIPHAVLDPLRDKLREGSSFAGARSGTWPSHTRGALEEMDAILSAELASVQLRVRDILNFQVGDIIDLGADPEALLRILVEGKPKYLAKAGVRKGRKAVRITGRITNGAEHGKKEH